MLVFVRFTGSRVGSTWYQAPGTQRYAFGQNPTHRLQGVWATEWPMLKAKFGAWLLEVPPNKARSDMPLGASLVACDLPALDLATKEALLTAGLDTLGMVLAEDTDRLMAILPPTVTDPDRARNVWTAIALRVGLIDLAEVTTNVVEGPKAPQRANTPMQSVPPVVALPVGPTQAVAGKPLRGKRKRA